MNRPLRSSVSQTSTLFTTQAGCTYNHWPCIYNCRPAWLRPGIEQEVHTTHQRWYRGPSRNHIQANDVQRANRSSAGHMLVRLVPRPGLTTQDNQTFENNRSRAPDRKHERPWRECSKKVVKNAQLFKELKTEEEGERRCGGDQAMRYDR